jgi:pimeloyl-ACP methyl ester carboxylesterase
MAVAAEPAAVQWEPPTFKKPVSAKVPLTAYEPAYVARRKQVGEKILKLKDGRQLSYFTEGDPADPAVLCLHSLGLCKYQWLFPKPVPGVFLIAVDRQGHGNSSPYPPGLVRQFRDDLHEFVELLDALHVDKVHVTGCSMGGCWAIMVAAALGERVSACAPLCALSDPWNPSVTTAEQRKSLCPQGVMALLSLGDFGCNCKGGLMRWSMGMSFKSYPDKSKDPGFESIYNTERVRAIYKV